jgi:hypothetical protein
MNKDKALELALEALSATETNCGSRAWEREQEAIVCIKEALAAPVQESCCYGGIAHDCHAGLGCRIVKKLTATSPAAPMHQTCNCRWDGEVQVQQCTLHQAHVDAIHEWAERAKAAEAKLAAQRAPAQEPLSFNCSAGCGACGVKLQDFVTHQTQAQESDEWVVVGNQPQIVSTCCGSPVEVWDKRKKDITASVEAKLKELNKC